ncbi:MAG: hypothetical protein MSA22_00555 [Prevotella sp.]|nr:hypothetical protein [Prevotella sp.]
MDFVWLLMSNSKLLRIKNKQKTPYKKQKAASSYKILPLNGLMTVLGLLLQDKIYWLIIGTAINDNAAPTYINLIFALSLMGDMPTNKARTSYYAQQQSASNAVSIFYSVF